ncbi:MAG: hypothetical protein RLZZ230_221 [Candidatus Parcubacteria bacterium]|jgi:opacity protein-like surface antigen
MKQYLIFVFCFVLTVNRAFATDVGVEEKIKRVYELYLQNSTVTLDKNAWRAGLDLSYLHDEKALGFTQYESRGATAQMSLNYGVMKDVELYAALPITWSNQKSNDALFNLGAEKSITQVGSLQLGINYNLLNATDILPTITTQLAVMVPIGNAQNNNVAVTAGVSLNKSFDPAFIYGGLHYTKGIGGDKSDGLAYQLGVGFSVNHRIALGLEYSGGYVYSTTAFSSKETSMITARTTFMFDKNTIIQPRVSLGLNDSAADSIVGVNVSRRF